MALQIRRGIESERTAVTFAEGELVYITDTDKLYIGDNTTVGGIEIGPKTLSELGAVSLSGNLTLGGNNITGTGNINITGDIQASGNITAGGNIDIGDAADDTLTISAKVDSSITPNVDATYNLGSSALKWNNIHAVRLDGDVEGSVFGDDSSLLVDGVNNKVVLTNNTTTELSEGTNLYYTDVRADARITNAGSANWNTAFGWGNHASAGYQVAGAAIDGDIEGSVFGDDSTLLVDAVNNLIPATVISGTLANDTTGNAATATKLATARLIGGVSFDGISNITLPGVNSAGNQNITGDAAGDHTGTFTGNVFTTLIDSADSSAIVITPSLRTSSDVAIDQELRVGSTNTTGPGGQTVVITPGNGASGTGKVSTDVLEVKSIEILDADGGIVTLTGELDISKTLTTNAGHLGFGPNNLLTYNGVSASLRVAEFTASLETAGAFDNAANFNNFMTVDSASAKFGVPVQFGSYTTTQRNALAGVVNGLVIYNSTDDKFQGRAGGAWVNLH